MIYVGRSFELVREALDIRSRRVVEGDSDGAPPSFVRHLANRHSRRAIRRLLCYFARLTHAEILAAMKACGDEPDSSSSSAHDRPEELEFEDLDKSEVEAERLPVITDGASPVSPAIRDEWNQIVPTAELMARIDGWCLKSDAENLSPASRRLLDQALDLGGDQVARALVADLPAAKRFRNVQAVHVLMSVPVDKNQPLERQLLDLEFCVGETVRQTFLMFGHRVLWTLHAEPGGQLHAHLLVKAVSEEGERLRFDWDNLLVDGLRAVLAQSARFVGLRVTELRISDRADIVERVANGTATREEVLPLLAGRLTLPTRVEQEAPRWFAEHGDELAERLAKTKAQRKVDVAGASDSESRPLISKTDVSRDGEKPEHALQNGPGRGAAGRELGSLGTSLKVWRVYCDEPETRRALERFEKMDAENARFARWCLVHQPGVFGLTGAGATDLASDGTFRRCVRKLPIPPGQRATRPRNRREIAGAPSGASRGLLDLSERRAVLRRMSSDLYRLASQLERFFPPGDVIRDRAVPIRERAAAIRQRSDRLTHVVVSSDAATKKVVTRRLERGIALGEFERHVRSSKSPGRELG